MSAFYRMKAFEKAADETSDNGHALTQYLIGALCAEVSDKAWGSCLDTARRLAADAESQRKPALTYAPPF